MKKKVVLNITVSYDVEPIIPRVCMYVCMYVYCTVLSLPGDPLRTYSGHRN